jgi:hypothetical protein
MPAPLRELLADYLWTTRRLCAAIRAGELEEATACLQHRFDVLHALQHEAIDAVHRQRVATLLATAERRAAGTLALLEEAALEVQTALQTLAEHRRGGTAFRHSVQRPAAGNWLDCTS